MNWSRGEFNDFVVKRSFQLGDHDIPMQQDLEFEYDGYLLRIGTDEYNSTKLRAGLAAGWFGQTGDNSAVAAPRASIKMSATTPQQEEERKRTGASPNIQVERHHEERVAGSTNVVGEIRNAPADVAEAQASFAGARVAATIQGTPLKNHNKVTSGRSNQSEISKLNQDLSAVSTVTPTRQRAASTEDRAVRAASRKAQAQAAEAAAAPTPKKKRKAPAIVDPSVGPIGEFSWDPQANKSFFSKMGQIKRVYSDHPAHLQVIFSTETVKVQARIKDMFPSIDFD